MEKLFKKASGAARMALLGKWGKQTKCSANSYLRDTALFYDREDAVKDAVAKIRGNEEDPHRYSLTGIIGPVSLYL